MEQPLFEAARRSAEPAALRHAQRLAAGVVQALADEVTLSPKPGLVDIRSRGAHRDLDWALMCLSAQTLRPTFTAMAEAGQRIRDLVALRERIGHLGRLGEATMLRATGGINTHRGAIWSLGLLVTAAAQVPGATSAAEVTGHAGALARLPDRFAPLQTGNKGERACRQYGVGGARSQAQAGFPHITNVALPELQRSRRRGDPEDAARLNALLAVMGELDDTCVLSRGGTRALRRTHLGAKAVLEAGGVAATDGRRALHRLDTELLVLNVSPGGAADLLAATLFLDRLANEFMH